MAETNRVVGFDSNAGKQRVFAWTVLLFAIFLILDVLHSAKGNYLLPSSVETVIDVLFGPSHFVRTVTCMSYFVNL